MIFRIVPRQEIDHSSPLPQLLKKNADVSVEQVALLAQQNTLPEPTLDISMLSYSAGPPQSLSAAAYSNSTNPSVAPSGSSSSSSPVAVLRSTSAVAAAAVAPPPADDPWMAGVRPPFGAAGINGGGAAPPPSSVAGTGLPAGWWKKLEKVTVQFAGQQGFVLNRYMVYGITTEVRRRPRLTTLPDFFPLYLCASVRAGGGGLIADIQRGGTVQRRYSEFAFLWDCLVRRYPFRLLPQLPPKRIGRA